jgi:HK97 family phage prohead protease
VDDVIDPLGLTSKGNIPLLLNHKHDQPVGNVTFGQPTPRGLPFTARIAKVDAAGEVKTRTDTAWHSVKAGIIKGVSIGFRPLASKPLPTGGTHFSKAEVHELSLVAVPANPDAVITHFKSAEHTNSKEFMHQTSIADQIRKAIAMTPVQAIIADTAEKSAVAPGTTVTYGSDAALGGLYYPSQQAGVLTPPVTTPIATALAQLGAMRLPPNVRALTQSQLLVASEVPEDNPYPAAAGDIEVTLQGNRKFGLIIPFSSDLVRLGGDAVVGYIEDQLTTAANNATDAFMVGLLGAGTAAAGVSAALLAHKGDLRTSVWIGLPETLAGLRSPTETEVGPTGGRYMQLPAVASLAVPADTLYLVDVKRAAVYDGAMTIERTSEASIVLDTNPAGSSAVAVSMFQNGMVALKVTKYCDAAMIVPATVVSLS